MKKFQRRILILENGSDFKKYLGTPVPESMLLTNTSQTEILEIIKFNYLYTITCDTFIFEIALGTHPSTINNLFVNSKKFDRNFEFLLK